MMIERARRWLMLSMLVILALAGTPAHAQVLGIQGSKFTVDGAPRFLVMFSYFAALRPTGANATGSNIPALWSAHKAELAAHFAGLRARGFDGIRVFPSWHYTLSGTCGQTVSDGAAVINRDGSLNFAAGQRLLEVIELARQHRLVVDVTWAIECAGPTVPYAMSKAAYFQALTWITAAMAGGYKNAFFDLENEYNYAVCLGVPNQKPAFTRADWAAAIGPIRAADPTRIVTASVTIDRDLAIADAQAIGFDVVAFHDPRTYSGNTPVWPGQTRAVAAAARLQTTKPIYFQEPDRYRPTGVESNLTALHFLTALQGAIDGGAAAWTFHNDGTFKLGGAPIGLHPVEVQFLDNFRFYVDFSRWP
jgi:hypothetical protein